MNRALPWIIAIVMFAIGLLAGMHIANRRAYQFPRERLVIGKWYYVAERANGHYEYQDCNIRRLKDIMWPRLLFEDQHGHPNKFDMVMGRDVVGEAPEPEPKVPK